MIFLEELERQILEHIETMPEDQILPESAFNFGPIETEHPIGIVSNRLKKLYSLIQREADDYNNRANEFNSGTEENCTRLQFRMEDLTLSIMDNLFEKELRKELCISDDVPQIFVAQGWQVISPKPKRLKIHLISPFGYGLPLGVPDLEDDDAEAQAEFLDFIFGSRNNFNANPDCPIHGSGADKKKENKPN